MKKIILASKSPRRKEILKNLGLNFVVKESAFQENNNIKLAPKKLVELFAVNKAKDVLEKSPETIVIGSDTLVVFENKVMGKPKNKQDAKKMLRKISSNSVQVITGLCVMSDEKIITKTKTTKVYFKNISEYEIDKYIKSKEPMDKAGAFGIQGLGSTLIKKIEGDYFAVMGLPIFELSESLKKFGVEILK
ncbi:septum formation inhibitor Maf [Candidatus Parcubacteria bacterium]|nr:MAG: septum formation inhibitor Maf [Candidatus Parcubacteria bacterium]